MAKREKIKFLVSLSRASLKKGLWEAAVPMVLSLRQNTAPRYTRQIYVGGHVSLSLDQVGRPRPPFHCMHAAVSM